MLSPLAMLTRKLVTCDSARNRCTAASSAASLFAHRGNHFLRCRQFAGKGVFKPSLSRNDALRMIRRPSNSPQSRFRAYRSRESGGSPLAPTSPQARRPMPCSPILAFLDLWSPARPSIPRPRRPLQ
jgi:hypothetical protein